MTNISSLGSNHPLHHHSPASSISPSLSPSSNVSTITLVLNSTGGLRTPPSDLVPDTNGTDLLSNILTGNFTKMDFADDRDAGIPWWDFNLDLQSVTSVLASITMIFGGIIPYIPQYREISRTQNATGFSTYVCLTLIAANTLRIIFWFGNQFEIPLLLQSIFMIVSMFIMMNLCLRVRRKNPLTTQQKQAVFTGKTKGEEKFTSYSFTSLPSKSSSTSSPTPTSSPSSSPTHTRRAYGFVDTIKDLNWRHFWQWTDLMSYIECTAAFTVIVGMLMYLFMHSVAFVETIGYLSLMTEALLATPQLLKNHINKSTIGMSYMMVLLWALGDLFKTGYFLIKEVPTQFVVCGVIQVTVDILILVQVSIYHREVPDVKNAKDPKS